MIILQPLNKEISTIPSNWYKNDPEGDKRIGSYADIEKWLSLLNSKNRWSWVIFDKKIPIGFLDLELMKGNKGGFAFYVAPDLRGKGYGQILIKELIKIAQKKNIDYLYCGVEEDNISSIKILKKLNFEKVGKDKDDMVELQLKL